MVLPEHEIENRGSERDGGQRECIQAFADMIVALGWRKESRITV